MNEEDIKEFTAALAARYLQVQEEYRWRSRRFIVMDETNTPADDYKRALISAEHAFAKWALFNDVIRELPLDVKQAFITQLKLLRAK